MAQMLKLAITDAETDPRKNIKCDKTAEKFVLESYSTIKKYNESHTK